MGLEKLRKNIDKIDSEIIKLLNLRINYASQIGKIKKKKDMEFYVPSREQAIFESLKRENKGPFPDAALKSIYKEILSATRSIQHPLKIAYFGPEATFTHMASKKQFGSSAEYIPVKSIKDVFLEVEHGWVDYGVVPIENSTEGVVNYTLEMFVDSNIKIYEEIFIEISNKLLYLY
ncbi:MAG: chorismate mutase [Candidatus Firestonebacteria bacterium]|nr:chorismate mutase [Candidatus Firestonebacteria bacterium]